jgi:uncharacterized protein (TIGR02246 family)
MMELSVQNEVHVLYQQLIDAWNKRSAQGMAELFLEDGEMIGFDGSQIMGREQIFSTLHSIFDNHPTAPFVSKVKAIRLLSADVALLRAIVGMVPPGQADLNPAVNAHQTLVAVQKNGVWRIELFQNTPAQFHGRPDLVEQMSDELRELLK